MKNKISIFLLLLFLMNCSPNKATTEGTKFDNYGKTIFKDDEYDYKNLNTIVRMSIDFESLKKTDNGINFLATFSDNLLANNFRNKEFNKKIYCFYSNKVRYICKHDEYYSNFDRSNVLNICNEYISSWKECDYIIYMDYHFQSDIKIDGIDEYNKNSTYSSAIFQAPFNYAFFKNDLLFLESWFKYYKNINSLIAPITSSKESVNNIWTYELLYFEKYMSIFKEGMHIDEFIKIYQEKTDLYHGS
jgi:hypothetical protein